MPKEYEGGSYNKSTAALKPQKHEKLSWASQGRTKNIPYPLVFLRSHMWGGGVTNTIKKKKSWKKRHFLDSHRNITALLLFFGFDLLRSAAPVSLVFLCSRGQVQNAAWIYNMCVMNSSGVFSAFTLLGRTFSDIPKKNESLRSYIISSYVGQITYIPV